MKRFLFTILMILVEVCNVHAQQICFCYKGQWSGWDSFLHLGTPARYPDGSGFCIHDYSNTEYFRFVITNYIPPTKQEIKEHLKTNTWFEYTGYVEYYVNDYYPTAQDLAKKNWLVIPDARNDETPTVKRHASATIKIAPYKKAPYCFNIWFDNIGIGLDFKGLKYGNVELK